LIPAVPLEDDPVHEHVTSHCPAVNGIEVTFVSTVLVCATPDAVFVTVSPSLPACALSFVVVPTMPAVLDGVIVLVA
jgi:hypothetical protein